MDTVTSSSDVKIEYFFVDGDTRTQTVRNCTTASATAAKISSLNSYLQRTNLLVGDKTAATFGKITKATLIQKQTTSLDLLED